MALQEPSWVEVGQEYIKGFEGSIDPNQHTALTCAMRSNMAGACLHTFDFPEAAEDADQVLRRCERALPMTMPRACSWRARPRSGMVLQGTQQHA